MSSDVWTAISAVSTLVEATVVTATAILVFIQLKEMAAARSLEALSRVFDTVTTEEMSEARRYVLSQELPPPGEASPEVYRKMHKVWVSFDNLGLLVDHGMLPEEIALDMFYDTVVRCWQKLETHIQHERETRGTKYQKFFEMLYHRSVEHSRRVTATRSE